jgi:hypothetical protein
VRTDDSKEDAMRLSTVAALSGIAAVALAISGLPADAAPKKRTQAASQNDVNVSSQQRTRRTQRQRTRTRITVRPRSYLDAGTEVLPGERKFNDYAFPPGHTPMRVLAGPATPAGPQNPGWPLPGPFFPWPP